MSPSTPAVGTKPRQGESTRARRERLEAERAAALAAAERRRRLTIGAIVALVLAVVGGIAGVWAWQNAERSATPTASVGSVPAKPLTLENGKPLVFGNPDASTVLEIWENPRCPHCVEFQERYAGQINDAVRDNRIALHVYGLAGGDQTSVAALHGLACAAEAGYGLQFWDGIYQNPNAAWSEDQVVALFKAVSGGADATRFHGCVQSKKHAEWLASISEAARVNKIEYTPTLKRNGTEVDIPSLTPEKMKELLS